MCYSIQFEPVITSETTAHVHHMLIYKCKDLTEANVTNGPCHTIHQEARDCRNNLLVAGWAVGAGV